MAISCDPSDLANASRCFSSCRGDEMAIRSLLLCQYEFQLTCVKPTSPDNPSVSSTTQTTISISWTEAGSPQAPVTGFRIKWGTTLHGNDLGDVQVAAAPLSYTITGLSPSQTIFFEIFALSNGCQSAFSTFGTGTTNPPVGCGAGLAFTNAWAARVVANGGAAPSQATKDAINIFQCGLITDGLDTLVYSWNTFVSDNLIAALTPQLVGAGTGSDPWINHGFVAGDLTVNGLTGDGVAKYLDTGLLAQTVWGAANPNTSSGLTIYLETNPTLGTTTCFVGSSDGSPSLQQLETFNGSIFCRLFDVGSQATIANALFTGYMSAQRTALNALSIYEANSGIAHHTLVTSNVNNGGNPATPIFKISVFAYNDNTGPSLFAPQTLGFVCLHQTGLSSAQSALFSVRVQTLMSALGRAI